ncbi:MAG: hypothetical protein ED559_06100 [Phycisphaera sp.]|nr:MAG: hypothetical protein ED559_06100 [Phycisphaera sp.]
MDRHNAKRCVLSLALLAALWIAVRQLGLTGADSSIEFIDTPLLIGVTLISLWGLKRVLERTGP